jgi:hypothetical protein
MTTAPISDHTRTLLAWADSYCPKGAAAIKKASSPAERDRCLAKLDGLWWEWGAKVWAKWTPRRPGHSMTRVQGRWRPKE